MAHDITIYGSSDDLVEVEGALPECDEYPTDDAHFVLFGEDNKSVRIRVWYTRRGLWAIAAAPVEEDKPMLPVELAGADHNAYSSQAKIKNVTALIHEYPPTDE